MIIAIAGQSGSGKSTFARIKQKELNAVSLTMDDFYFDRQRVFRTSDWADNPQYIDIERLVSCIKSLRNGEPTLIPQFSPLIQDRIEDKLVMPKKHLIVEGLWVLTFPQIRELADCKYFIDVPLEIRLKRRIVRDVGKGYSGKETEKRSSMVEGLGNQFIEPFKKYADYIIS